MAENILVTDEESSDIMNVLFVGNDLGQFTLRLYGGFETDSISLPKLLDAYGVRGYKVFSSRFYFLAFELQSGPILTTFFTSIY